MREGRRREEVLAVGGDTVPKLGGQVLHRSRLRAFGRALPQSRAPVRTSSPLFSYCAPSQRPRVLTSVQPLSAVMDDDDVEEAPRSLVQLLGGYLYRLTENYCKRHYFLEQTWRPYHAIATPFSYYELSRIFIVGTVSEITPHHRCTTSFSEFIRKQFSVLFCVDFFEFEQQQKQQLRQVCSPNLPRESHSVRLHQIQ